MSVPVMLRFTCLAFACMALVRHPMLIAEAAVSCGSVVGKVLPCISYLRFGGGGPSKPCCDGVKYLNVATKGTPARQATCGCLKQAAATIPGLKLDLVGSLPGKCGVSFPYRISPSIDCSKVK